MNTPLLPPGPSGDFGELPEHWDGDGTVPSMQQTPDRVPTWAAWGAVLLALGAVYLLVF